MVQNYRLTKKEIRILDVLYRRWEKSVSDSNRLLLIELCQRAGIKGATVPKKLKSIDIELLKREFVGNGKLFDTVWSMLHEFGTMAHDRLSRQFRIKLPSGAILVVHPTGSGKEIVLTLFHGDKARTYKKYGPRHSDYLNAELGFREHDAAHRGKLFTRLLSVRRGKTSSYTKEEYGGADLAALCRVARLTEKNIVLNMGFPPLSIESLSNFAYNPKTKRIYKIDLF